MKALLRTLLAVIGVLGLVMVAAVVYITTFFDPNDLKPRLIEVVRQQSGLELALDGPLSWSFYPRLGVSVEQAEAWLPDQPHEEPFVAFERAEVSLSLAPLLSGEIAIDGLTLDAMHLNLRRDEQGRGNWQVLLERLRSRGEEAEEALAPASSGPDTPAGGDMAVALNIASVQVRNGEILFSDRQNGLELRLDDLMITGSNVNPNSAFPLKTSFSLASFADAGWRDVDDPEPEVSSDVSFESRVRLGLRDGRYVLEGLALDTRTSLAALEDRQQQVNLRAKQLTAELEADHYQLEEGQLDASVSHPALGDKPLPLSLTFMADADLAAETLQLRELLLTSEDSLKLSGALEMNKLFAVPQYSGQLQMAPMSLRPWLTRTGMMPETASDSALSDVALTSPVQGSGGRFELTNLTLVLDDSTFTGRLGAGLDGQSLSFDLQGDQLDLDAYLPPPPTENGSADSAARLELPGIASAYAEEAAGELLPVGWLSALTLDGQLTLNRLKAFDLAFDEVSLKARGSDGQQRLERFDARFYEGNLSTTAALDLRQEPVRWTLTPTLEQVRIVPLFEALNGDESPLRGRLNLDGELTSRGNTLDLLKRNLNGRTALRINDGAVLDVNVSQELCTAVATLEGEEVSREWSPDTRFDRAQATLVFRDGVVHNDDLEITLPGIALGGEGELNLVTERFDYAAAARFVDTADAACRVNPRLERVPFPVRCEGEFGGNTSEWCRFDRQAFQQALGKLARDEAKRRAGEEIEERLGDSVEELEERLGEGASEELRDALRGLFE
ncbi:AsmA family protein [Litchfieldella rifensis]|uniref:AsmA family protein n=1 Tax=Litchfieldella rifensis TaxID=762643 RepID=A0ABV7LL51_9GAMM